MRDAAPPSMNRRRLLHAAVLGALLPGSALALLRSHRIDPLAPTLPGLDAVVRTYGEHAATLHRQVEVLGEELRRALQDAITQTDARAWSLVAERFRVLTEALALLAPLRHGGQPLAQRPGLLGPLWSDEVGVWQALAQGTELPHPGPELVTLLLQQSTAWLADLPRLTLAWAAEGSGYFAELMRDDSREGLGQLLTGLVGVLEIDLPQGLAQQRAAPEAWRQQGLLQAFSSCKTIYFGSSRGTEMRSLAAWIRQRDARADVRVQAGFGSSEARMLEFLQTPVLSVDRAVAALNRCAATLRALGRDLGVLVLLEPAMPTPSPSDLGPSD